MYYLRSLCTSYLLTRMSGDSYRQRFMSVVLCPAAPDFMATLWSNALHWTWNLVKCILEDVLVCGVLCTSYLLTRVSGDSYRRRFRSMALCPLSHSVQLQRFEDSDTFSACWFIFGRFHNPLNSDTGNEIFSERKWYLRMSVHTGDISF